MPKKMFLVDGSNHAFRVQFALPPRHTSDFFPTRVLYGFTLLFQKMLRTYRPDYCVVAFDSGKTFRHEMYEEYKGNRPPMPEDLRQQWPMLPEVVEAFGYPCLTLEGYEADDALGTLAHQFASEDLHVYIVSSDKDFAQLVGPHVSLLDDAKGRTMDEAGVVEKFGVRPDQIVDWLALLGDSSDNIPGVPGVGKKTATQLLQQYGSMTAVLDAAKGGEIKGKRGENLVTYADSARLSHTLAQICVDAPTGVTPEVLVPKGIQEERMRVLFDRLEFGAVARKLLPDRATVDLKGHKAVADEATFAAFLEEWKRADPLVFDLRIVGGNPETAVWVGISFWWSGGVAYVPLEPVPGVQFEVASVRQRVMDLLADPSVPKVTHGGKRQMRTLAAQGGSLEGLEGDLLLLDYVLAAHRRSHSLETLAQRHLGHSLMLVPPADSMLLSDVATYAAEPAHLIGALMPKLESRLSETDGRVYREIELPLLPVLAEVEANGIRLDLEVLSSVREDIASRGVEAEQRCHELAGKAFKVGSPKEVGVVLFDELGLPKGKKTKSGAWSTDSSVLEALLEAHELPGKILEYRRLQKLSGTYLDKLPQYVGDDGRIRTRLNQAVTATGRLSSADPNLQNIPIRTFEGRRIRDAFVASEGHVLMSFDYSQVELRVLAHFCDAQALIDSFQRGEDIHRRTASEVWGVGMDEVNIELRSAAKAINFGLLYGMSAFRLARDLQISRAEAQAHMDAYFGRMPAVPAWIEAVKEACRKDGYVETLYGRRRLIPEIGSKSFTERSGAEREAVNTVIQGTAADLIKKAMVAVHHALKASGTGARMLLQVHDELLVECPEGVAEQVAEVVVKEMMGAGDLLVPLHVNYGTGRNWNEAHG